MRTITRCYEQLKLDYPNTWQIYCFGKPCKKFNHRFYESERVLRNKRGGWCTECHKLSEQSKEARERQKKYRETNAEKIAEYDKQYQLENREKRLQDKRDWHKRNKEVNNQVSLQYFYDHQERCLENHRAWVKENPEKSEDHKRKRRARKAETLSDGGGYKAALYTIFDRSCAYCGNPLDYNNLCLDHVRSVNNRGDSLFRNFVPSCRSCNSSKHDKCLLIWYPGQSFFSSLRLEKIVNHCSKK